MQVISDDILFKKGRADIDSNYHDNLEVTDIIMYTVKDIQNIFHISKNQAYLLMNSNGFPAIRVNRKILSPKKELDKWISGNTGRQVLI